MTYEGGDRNYKPRDRNSGKGKRPYGKKNGFSGRSGEKKDFGDRPRREFRDHSDRREYKPRREFSDDGEKREFRPRREFRDHSDRDFKPKREFSDNGEKREYRPRRDFREHSDRDFKPRREFSDDGEKKEFRPRREHSDDRRDFKPRGYGHRDSGRSEYRPRNNDDFARESPRRQYEARDVTDEPAQRPKPVLPSDPQKLLFKGVDFQANGKDDIAMIMYLHGGALMSKGCENNALNMLREMDNDSITELRERMSKECSVDAMVEFDYLCMKIDASYDRTFFDSEFSKDNIHAIYCKIMLQELDGEDDAVETFASAYNEQPEKIVEGLKFLKRKKDSVKADECLQAIDAKKELKQSVRTHFIRAKKGERSSYNELKKLKSEFPEAAFFLEYLDAKEKGDAEEWLKAKYPQFGELIISVEPSLPEIRETPFGMFLRAKNIQAKKNEWIPPMIKAAKAGSEEALEELRPLLRRGDIKRVFATVYLNNNDLEKLLDLYRYEELDDVTYLDQYCKGDTDKVIQIGKELGRKDIKPEIEWLVRNVRTYGYVECKQALIKMASDSRYQSRVLIYALHDISEDVEAAKLYFAMALDPELPSVKWLRKLCDDEMAKEYIRVHYESSGDLATFESIFIDDGYRKKSFGKKPYGKKSFNKGKKRY